MFTNLSPLGKRYNVVKVPWPINYWVIDKDISIAVSPTPVKSVVLPLNVVNANSKSDNAYSHWLPTDATLTIMDLNQPELLMKLPVSIEQDSLQ